jgi:hypothetical protein
MQVDAVGGTVELAGFETDMLAGFVRARALAGLVDSTIRSDTGHLKLPIASADP